MSRARIFANKQELISSCIKKDDVVLDIGFNGQGIESGDPNWPHAILKKTAKDVYGVDLTIDRSRFPDTNRYQEASAEYFSFPNTRLPKVFAGDVIEHLPNPGLFLARVREHLALDGELIITTPNAFNLFNLAEKLTKDEPTVNRDHTCYFNHRTLRTLLAKCGFEAKEVAYVYSLEYTHKESLKKKFLNILYWLSARITPKFVETLVVIAVPSKRAV